MNPLHTAIPAMRLVLGALVLACIACGVARADAGWLLTTSDFRQEPVSFVALDDSGIRVVPVGTETPSSIPFDRLLQLDRVSGTASAAQEKFILVVANGDRLCGEPAGYKDEQILWRNRLFGEIVVPLKNARSLLRPGRSADADPNATEDRLVMANGDSLKGIITDLSGGKLKINANNNDVEVPLDSVAAVHFAITGKPEPLNRRALRLRLSDGSTLTVEQARSDGAVLHVAPPGGAPRPLPIAALLGLEQLNGPVSWLSSRTAESIVHRPYFGSLAFPARMDATVTGKPIHVAGRTFARGIGVHAYSRIDYALDGSYPAFRTQYAISNDGRTQYADVTVRIKVDDKVVHQREHLRADELPAPVLVDLPASARMLTLEVDYGDGNDTQDRFVWIEPALLKTRPPTTAPTTQPQ